MRLTSEKAGFGSSRSAFRKVRKADATSLLALERSLQPLCERISAPPPPPGPVAAGLASKGRRTPVWGRGEVRGKGGCVGVEPTPAGSDLL